MVRPSVATIAVIITALMIAEDTRGDTNTRKERKEMGFEGGRLSLNRQNVIGSCVHVSGDENGVIC